MLLDLNNPEIKIMDHLAVYGPLNHDTIGYDLDLDEELVEVCIRAMRKKKWIEGNAVSGYLPSGRFAWMDELGNLENKA